MNGSLERRLTRGALSALLSLPVSVSAQDPARGDVDPKAVALMGAVEAKMRAATSVEVIKQSTVREPMTGNGQGARLLSVRVKRPGMYRVETLDPYGEGAMHAYTSARISDGRLRLTETIHATRYDRATKQLVPLPKDKWTRSRFVERTGDDDIYVWDDDVQTLAGLYFVDDEHPGLGHDWRHHKLFEPTFNWIRSAGTEEWRGKRYEVVEWSYEIGIHPRDQQVHYRQKIYVGSDTIVYRVVTTTSRGAVLTDEFRRVTLNPSLPDSLFAIPDDPEIPRRLQTYEPKYGVGSTAPDFTLPASGELGRSITLSKALAGKKGAVLWFWGYF